MKKVIAVIIVIALAIAIFLFIRRSPKTTLTPLSENNSVETLSLPAGWQVISSADKAYKLEKSGDYQIKPLIVTSVTSLPAIVSGQVYIDQLIAGAKSTLPGLKYTVNSKENPDSLIARRLVGSYNSGKNKINVYQRITIQGETVTTLTASCVDDSCTEVEILPIFDTLASKLAN
jgi:hypothetical protein